jgi:hypothetical protein
MPEPARARARRHSVAYWVTAVLLYALVAVLYPPAALLGFWQSIPYLLVAHLLRPRVLGLLSPGPGRAA